MKIKLQLFSKSSVTKEDVLNRLWRNEETEIEQIVKNVNKQIARTEKYIEAWKLKGQSTQNLEKKLFNLNRTLRNLQRDLALLKS